ncbi:MAG: hypothetical protein MSH11_09515 [Ruminococcus sp.]|nr:hypothetical protein [Ruminococcus sp.]
MNKVKLSLDVAQLMLKVVHDLRTLSDSVQAVCNAVTEGLSEEQQPKAIEVKPVLKEKHSISLEQIRSVLAEKSQADTPSKEDLARIEEFKKKGWI